MHKGALDPALKDFNQAADIDPTNFYAYWNRGALRMAEADFASAQSDFTTALSLNPDASSKIKIEEVLNAATTALKAASVQAAEPGVITDPSQFGGEQEGSASAASSVSDRRHAGVPGSCHARRCPRRHPSRRSPEPTGRSTGS